MRFPRAVVATALLGATVGAHAAFSEIFVFGDSLSDAGNVLDLNGGAVMQPPFDDPVPDMPYAFGGGRFSNGPVWVEYAAADLGQSIFASTLGGTNYAYGGARSDDGLPNVPDSPGILSLTEQAAQALTDVGGPLPGDALYVVFGGGNDVRVAAEVGQADPADAQAVIEAGVTNIGALMTGLAFAGAQTILLANVPDVGLTPAAQIFGPVVAGQFTALSAAYNQGLAAAVDLVELSFPGLNIVEFDTFSFLNGIAADPGAFGLTNVSSGCAFGNGGLGCDNPDEFLFWDGIHPTTYAHSLLGAELGAVIAAIPLPPAAVLLAPALLLLAGRRRTL